MQTMRAIHTVHMHASMRALHAYVTSFGPYTHMLPCIQTNIHNWCGHLPNMCIRARVYIIMYMCKNKSLLLMQCFRYDMVRLHVFLQLF